MVGHSTFYILYSLFLIPKRSLGGRLVIVEVDVVWYLNFAARVICRLRSAAVSGGCFLDMRFYGLLGAARRWIRWGRCCGCSRGGEGFGGFVVR